MTAAANLRRRWRRPFLPLALVAAACAGVAGGRDGSAPAAAGIDGASPAAGPTPQAVAQSTRTASSLCFPTDGAGEIAASVYSLPAAFFDLAIAERLLAAVRALAPERTLVVLTDLPLEPQPRQVLIPTAGAGFSPWPRDPFSLARAAEGGVRVVLRPNLQPGREADAGLAEALVRGLPAALRQVWGEPATVTADVPFHNGQLLLGRDALWISLHSVEHRALELLGLDRVPVASFAAPGGAARYAAAAAAAADELAALYGRPARFVHPLPAGGPDDGVLMTSLGGGAGFDLDSLVTLLEPAASPAHALVADVSLGAALLPGADDPAWEALRQGFTLTRSGESLRRTLAAAQTAPPALALDTYVDLVAAHLARQGMKVERLPLLLVPVGLLGRPELDHREFLLTWNNVVVSTDAAGTLLAEGFTSLLAPLDAEATRRFAAAGARLALLPPLVESVVRNGGYRCASNHLRAGACPAQGATSSNR